MIITQTPLRVSLFGGGTDLPWFYEQEDGCVITTAIDKYIYVTVKPRFDDKIRVGYSKTEIVDRVGDLKHELIREALGYTHTPLMMPGGIEITTMADIPSEGSGLGSSSAVTVGTLNALYTYQGQQVLNYNLAEAACEIEITRCQKPIGKQDQYAAAMGGLIKLDFLCDGGVLRSRYTIPGLTQKLEEHLMLFYTGIARKADPLLASQHKPENIQILQRLKNLTKIVDQDLRSCDIESMGEFLHESWRLKKQLSQGVSNGFIDSCYEAARKAGARGGKITGAGGGGFLLLFAPYDRREAIRKALPSLRELPFHLEPEGSKVILNVGRNRQETQV